MADASRNVRWGFVPTMTAPNDNSSHVEETDSDRRRGILAHSALSVGLVSALAGDRPLTQAEENRLADLARSLR